MKTKILLLFLFISSSCFAQQAISFQKKSKPKRVIQIMPMGILLFKPEHGKLIRGMVMNVQDTMITIRKMYEKTTRTQRKEMRKKLKAIPKDNSMSQEEKIKMLFEILYPDTVQVSFSSLKKIRVPITSEKNGMVKCIPFIIGYLGAYYAMFEVSNNSFSKEQGTEKLIAQYAGIAVIFTTSYFLMNKNITPQKWDIKKGK